MIEGNALQKNGKPDVRGKNTEEKEEQDRKEQEISDKIRVLLKTDGFSEEVHAQVTVTSEAGLVLSNGEEQEEVQPEETVTILPDDAMFRNGGTIRITSNGGKISVSSLKRGYGVPEYRGSLELFSTPQGIAMINELPLEEYLYGVVPSEMPASYEAEALKTQAVCARSYARCHMQNEAYPEYRANVDDSTAYQVYGNSEEQENTNSAVDETKGEYLVYNGQPVKAYYFSTSCGYTTDVEAWGTKVGGSNAYLKSAEISENGKYYEEDLPWFSWSCDIPEELLSNLFGLNTGQDIGMIQTIDISKRGSGNIALEMKVTGTKGSCTVRTENKIRSALGGSGYSIVKQDGSKTASSGLLPSAFFTIRKNEDMFHIDGGGYGHGIGMSQNGANEMAKKGKDYKTILHLFYHGIEIAKE